MDLSHNNDGEDLDYDDYDIIIVGGGLTGLSAAYHIAKKHANLSLMIIESEDLIGGRLNSGDLKLHIHSFQDNIRRLLRELKLETQSGEEYDDKSHVYCDENGPFDSISSLVSSEVYYCLKSLNESSLDQRLDSLEFNEEFSELAELSVNDLIDRMVLSPRAKCICQSLISLTCGFTSLENVSALWLLTVLHGAGGLFQRLKFFLSSNSRFFIKERNSTLLQRLKETILNENGVINCSERVNTITFNEYRNFVSTDKKGYKCSYVIVAVSPPHSGEIICKTQLPENYLKTQTSYVFNKLISFTSNYRNNFWHPNHSGIIIPLVSSRLKHLRLTHDIIHPIDNEIKTLSGYFSSYDDTTVHDRSVELSKTLNKCFNVSNVDHYHVNYCEKLLGRGLMSVLRPCPIQYHSNPMRMPHKRIFFAASEYARRWPGTADGAVEAGEHVACLVLNYARPQTLTGAQISTYLPTRARKPDSNFEVFMAQSVLLIANSMIFWYFFRSAYDF